MNLFKDCTNFDLDKKNGFYSLKFFYSDYSLTLLSSKRALVQTDRKVDTTYGCMIYDDKGFLLYILNEAYIVKNNLELYFHPECADPIYNEGQYKLVYYNIQEIENEN